jgi:DNA-binding NarL/FixJ family response regulator
MILGELSEREHDVLIRLDMTNKEIASDLGIKHRTVEHRVEVIFKKLKVTSRVEAALKGVQMGLIKLPGVTVTSKGT